MIEAIKNEPPPSSKQKDIIQHEPNPSLDIIIWLHVVINLDDNDEVAKIDKEVHNELNTLFSSSMSLNDNYLKKSVEHGDDPS